MIREALRIVLAAAVLAMLLVAAAVWMVEMDAAMIAARGFGR